jgi:diguanylate cyclase (GGDEF)-like protein
MGHDVFISFSTKDRAVADAVCAALEREGIRCWISHRDVPPGSNFMESILAAIRAARVFILVFSAEANHSDHVKREVTLAIDSGLVVIPFRIENTSPSGAMAYVFSTVQWLDAATPPVEKHIKSLIDLVKAKCGQPTSTTPVPVMQANLDSKALEGSEGPTVVNPVRDIYDMLEKQGDENPYIIVISGRSAGRTYQLSEGELTIGRSPNCTIQLDEDGVSRRHARLVKGDRKDVRIVDLGSTNGTFVNGEYLGIKTLRDGDLIQIGSQAVLKFSWLSPIEESFQRGLYESARKDPLTKITNKKAFMELFHEEFDNADRRQHVISLILFDIDHFKKVNDTHGHRAGDVILRRLAEIVQGAVPDGGVFARVGGEEFAVLLHDCDEDHAFSFAERIRSLVGKSGFEFQGASIPVHISVGCATRIGNNFGDPDEMHRVADEFLFKAKNDGRNCVRSVLNENEPVP